MTEEPELGASEIVERYRSHGIPSRTHKGGIFVEREEGWEGPLDPQILREIYLDEIDRLVGDARVAAVTAICHENDEMRKLGFRALPMESGVHLMRMRPLLQKAGLSEQKSKLYASIVSCLCWRGELLR